MEYVISTAFFTKVRCEIQFTPVGGIAPNEVIARSELEVL